MWSIVSAAAWKILRVLFEYKLHFRIAITLSRSFVIKSPVSKNSCFLSAILKLFPQPLPTAQGICHVLLSNLVLIHSSLDIWRLSDFLIVLELSFIWQSDKSRNVDDSFLKEFPQAVYSFIETYRSTRSRNARRWWTVFSINVVLIFYLVSVTPL